MWIAVAIIVGITCGVTAWNMTDPAREPYVLRKGYWNTRKDAQGHVIDVEYVYDEN